MKISRLKLAEYEAMPRWYGLAYWDFPRAEAICYPIPLNLIVRAIRLFYFRLAIGLFSPKFEKRWLETLHKAERRGWEIGKEYGYGQGKADGIAEMWGKEK